LKLIEKFVGIDSHFVEWKMKTSYKIEMGNQLLATTHKIKAYI